MKMKPTIFTVATAHLDTVWNWDFETTVGEYIPKTLDENFAYFEQYPEYVFSFEGSYRYELMEEYYPQRFEKLKKYIADGRWFVTGSAYENGDVNVPSPEALFRNILYGNGYFLKKFGKRSVDIYLPDCFGFGYALPSIIVHAGLYGFTTQKLTWSSAYGIPFDLGLWQGVDGKKTFASLNALSYNATLREVREHSKAREKLDANIKYYDLPFTYLLHGVGDIGGAPRPKSVETAVTEHRSNANFAVDVELVSVDYPFRVMKNELSEAQKQKLPVWNNELVSTNHGVGAYTSRAVGKRFNKHNELLADAAERYSCLASWLGAADYPQKQLDKAWKRVIAHEFHDDITGTSLERVYKRSWNDYVLSLNAFSSIYETAVEAVVKNMTSPFKSGVCVAVTNPTGYERTGAVFCKIKPGAKFVCVTDYNGKKTPSQLEGDTVTFIASLPANSVALYCITKADKPYKQTMEVTERTLENGRYRVTLDDNGDICSVFDKKNSRELLKKPVSMDIHEYNGSKDWPAWELVYEEVMAQPIGSACEPSFRISSSGAARIAVETRRKFGTSVFIQTVSLEYGSDIVRIDNEIEWQGNRKLLKTPFCFTVENEEASYDLGLGVIKRPTNTPKLYEVPAQNFADISEEDFGVSVLSECKNGWDHPDKSTLRLTGIHTPRGNYREDSQQSQMDLGRNRYSFAIFAHEGASLAGTHAEGIKFVQPMRAFDAKCARGGCLGSVYSFAGLSCDEVIIRAVKREQEGERFIVRVNEGVGKAHKGVRLRMASGIKRAWAANAFEEELYELETSGGEAVFDIGAYEPMTVAVELEKCAEQTKKTVYEQLSLDYNACITSPNSAPRSGMIYGATLPRELFESSIECSGVKYALSEIGLNAVRCVGQKIALPKGAKTVRLLVMSTHGDKTATFECGGEIKAFIPDCCEAVGAWDLYSMHEKGYIKDNCTLAYEFTHMHSDTGDIIAKQCYAFEIVLRVSEDTLTLPLDSRLLVLAGAASREETGEGRLFPMYDTLKRQRYTYVRPKLDARISRGDKLVFKTILKLYDRPTIKKLVNKIVGM